MSETKSKSIYPLGTNCIPKYWIRCARLHILCTNETYTNISYPALPFCKHIFHLDLFQYCCTDIAYSIVASLWTSRLCLLYDSRCMFDITCRSYELR